jgi:Class II Aldolase and Adducin N-terminal domain
MLANEGVLDAFGHVSMRHPTDPERYRLSRSRWPELVQPADILEFALDSEPIVSTNIRLYGERVVHGCIYQARPDVNAVCHHHASAILPFCISGVELVPVYRRQHGRAKAPFFRALRLVEHHHPGDESVSAPSVPQAATTGNRTEILLNIARVVRLVKILGEEFEEALIIRIIAALKRIDEDKPTAGLNRLSSMPTASRQTRNVGGPSAMETSPMHFLSSSDSPCSTPTNARTCRRR